MLGAIPYACVNVQLDDLDYQANCPDETGGLFTIFDLKQCFFHIDNVQVLSELAIVFPTDPICGDGTVQGNEECDDGLAGNSDTAPNACRTDCTDPACHDGVHDPAFGEQCDDGNTVNGDGCSGECVLDTCGDGTIQGAEQCDDGAGNSNTSCKCRATGPNACRTAKCGDTIVDTCRGEECDDGNLLAGDGCSALCLTEFCGDDFINNKPCSTNPNVPTCEECDDGVDNGNQPDGCRTNCKGPRCGDGVTDPSNGETCDDGNSINNDACSNTCSVCGDGIKAPLEECDTNSNVCPAGEGCNSSCECESACPTVGELTLYAGFGTECATNAECPVGVCDLGKGRCRTGTRLDSGWTGLAHSADINDGLRTRGFLQCAGHGPVCGECNVIGVDSSLNTCRCSNNTRTICDEPFAPSSNDCPACVGGVLAGGSCGANADCNAGTCSKRCVNNAAVCSTNTDCPGSSCAASATTCSNKSTCSTNSDCTGTCTARAACDCYFGAPFPLSSGGTPACIVNRFSQNISGTANVDEGAGKIAAKLRTRVYLGISTTNPCPTCGGKCSNDATKLCERALDCSSGGTCVKDPVADDNIRGGFCINGAQAGLSCDITAINTSFPAYPESEGGTEGGGYSLDCLPDSGKNISGAGLIINLTQTTGRQELFSNVSCTGQNPELNCPCLQCSGDPEVPCNADSDCAGQQGSCSLAPTARCSNDAACANVDVGPCIQFGQSMRCRNLLSKTCAVNGDCFANVGPCSPSACTAKGIGSSGSFPLPNQCDDLLCSDVGSNLGKCTLGPDEKSCDGVVKANGDGVLACNANADCTPAAVGTNAGICSLVARRSCFLNPIVSQGAPHPSEPLGAAAFCVPPTSNSAINDVAGLPGPGRIVNQAKSKTFCGSDPTKQYIPGEGGCLQD